MKLEDTFDVIGADVVAPPHIYTNSGKHTSALRGRVFRRMMDVTIAVTAAPVVLFVAVVLILLNPAFNPGPLFFRQKRMGKDCRSFMVWKFRTMRMAERPLRHVDDPLDSHRITRLGAILRKSRLDELPNLINVLRGEMAVIGPRPDAWDHAVVHIRTIPHYAKRFAVLPGITGLAQVRAGYADDEKSIRRKARLDSFYVKRRSARLDATIVLATFAVMMTGFGGR